MATQKIGPKETALRASREAEYKAWKKAKKAGVKRARALAPRPKPPKTCPNCGWAL